MTDFIKRIRTHSDHLFVSDDIPGDNRRVGVPGHLPGIN